MKKSVTIVFGLCSTIGMAQTFDISSKDAQICAEFVAVKYTDAWIKTFKGNKNEGKNYEAYIQQFPNVEKWTVDSVACFNEYFEWLSDTTNNWGGTNKTLTEVVKNRNANNIDFLLVPPNEKYEKNLLPIKEELSSLLSSWCRQKQDEKQKLAEYKTEQPRRERTGEEQRNSVMDRLIGLNHLPIITMIILVVIIAAIVGFIAIGGLRNYIIKTVIGSGRVNEKFGNSDNVPNTSLNVGKADINRLKERIDELERKVEKLEKCVRELSSNISMQRSVRQEQKIEPITTASDSERQSAQPQLVYVEKLSNGRLKDCGGQKRAQYKIIIAKSGNSKFEFCGDLEEAKANANAIFDDVCTFDGKLSKATKCDTVQQGEVERDGNYWKVIKKATIKFS